MAKKNPKILKKFLYFLIHHLFINFILLFAIALKKLITIDNHFQRIINNYILHPAWYRKAFMTRQKSSSNSRKLFVS